MVAFEGVVRLAVSRPMPAVGEASNSPPYHALSDVPLTVLANAYRAAGPEVFNVGGGLERRLCGKSERKAGELVMGWGSRETLSIARRGEYRDGNSDSKNHSQRLARHPLQQTSTAIGGAVADIFDALIATLRDTRLEPDLEDLLWSAVNLFHRAADRVQRNLDGNEDAQKRCQKEQDGSEIRSVELERLVAEGLTLIERRNSMELFRDLAADQFERQASSAWRPRSGSMVNHRTLTAAMIDSRDFLAAKRRAETEPLLPAGPKIAFTGGIDFNDHHAIWDRLDKVHAKHPDMVLLHGGSPKGAERIAACWANSRKVPQIAFKPDWARHAKAAPLTASPCERFKPTAGFSKQLLSHCQIALCPRQVRMAEISR
jgi:hypothetical protein